MRVIYVMFISSVVSMMFLFFFFFKSDLVKMCNGIVVFVVIVEVVKFIVVGFYGRYVGIVLLLFDSLVGVCWFDSMFMGFVFRFLVMNVF